MTNPMSIRASTASDCAGSAVSVIIPTFNRARFIVRAVESVLANLTPGDELIVVDDESTDNTEQVLAPYTGRIRYVRNQHRGLGCGSARNRGIAEATRPLIAFLDSDDEWMAGKLALQRALMAVRPEMVYCFSDFGVRREHGPETRFELVGWHLDTRPWDEILAKGTPYSALAPLPPGRDNFTVHIGDMYPVMLRGNYVSTQTALVRRALAGDALQFAEDVPIYEEFECFSRLAKRGPAAFLNCETFWQWGHSGPRLSQIEEWDRANSRLKILPRIWGADPEFLVRHAADYRDAISAEHLTKARLLIAQGRTREARQELQCAGGGPLAYHVLSAMPGRVVRGMLGVRRFLRRAAAGRSAEGA